MGRGLKILLACTTIVASALTTTPGVGAANACGEAEITPPPGLTFDTVEMRQMPVPHCYIHGTFAPDRRFRMMLPTNWNGSFVQGISAALAGDEFQLDSLAPLPSFIGEGYAYAESNTGHINPVWNVDDTWEEHNTGPNHQLTEYALERIQHFYGRPARFKLLFGRSGGGWRGLSLIEKYPGVFDGANIGVPAIELRYLEYARSVSDYYRPLFRSKLQAIAAARDRGEDPTALPGLLTPAEAAALNQVYDAGWSKNSEFQWGGNGTPNYAETRLFDAGYFDDFWSQPGYEGHDGKVEARFPLVDNISGTVAAVGAPTPNGHIVTFTAEVSKALAANELNAYSIVFTSGGRANDPRWVHVQNNTAGTSSSFTVDGIVGDVHEVKVGDTFTVNNRDIIAWKYLHRHLVYCDRGEYKNYCANGRPTYVQRPANVQAATEGDFAFLPGKIVAPLIISANTTDTAVFHQQLKEYVDRVRANLGNRSGSLLRVYWTEHGVHINPSPTQLDRGVSSQPVHHAAWQLLQHWVIDHTPPPPDTVVDITPQDFAFPANAADRKGLQPTISGVTANGTARSISVPVGTAVAFGGTALSPIGKIATYEWDFDSNNAYDCASQSCSGSTFTPAKRVEIRATHTYTAPGTYVATVRVTDDAMNPAGFLSGIQNLAHIVVTVR